jgi:putative membrane protein
MTRSADRWLTGTAAGLAATVPMTVFMVVAHRLLPRGKQRELPPARITGAVLRAAGLKPPAEGTPTGTVLANHLAYGAAMGALYRGVIQPWGDPTAASGLAYGLGVWAGSYLGWLPVAGLHPSAAEEPRERNALMIVAHAIWGLGFTVALRTIEQYQTPDSEVEDNMASASDRFTIIYSASGNSTKTLATGLTRDQARQWLERKASETGRTVSADLTIEDRASNRPDSPRDERWQAVKAE